ncbi:MULTISPECIES: AHH domain-containing protein [unclassified Thiocapsa]
MPVIASRRLVCVVLCLGMLGMVGSAPAQASWLHALKRLSEAATAKHSAPKASGAMPRSQYGTALRGNMQAVNKVCQLGWQAHHLIPVALEQHRAVQKCALDINAAVNGLCMPGAKVPAPGPIRPHQGYHAGYNNAVKTALDGIPKSVSKAETCRRLERIQTCLRDGIGAGSPLYGQQVDKVWRQCRP